MRLVWLAALAVLGFNVFAKGAPSDYFTKSSKIWRTVSYLSFILIAGLIVLNIFQRAGKKEILDKSLAVLPFINDSQDQENGHFINEPKLTFNQNQPQADFLYNRRL